LLALPAKYLLRVSGTSCSGTQENNHDWQLVLPILATHPEQAMRGQCKEALLGTWSRCAPSVVEVDVLLSQHTPTDAWRQHVLEEAVELQLGTNKGLAVTLTQTSSQSIKHWGCNSMCTLSVTCY